jgi:signal peptidase I
MVTASICPICRYQMNFRAGGPDESVRHATYKGDRILVAKFPYEFSDPERWDVAVFKNPGEAKQNYIKRVVGLPNEIVVVCHGDIHTTQNDPGYGPLDATVVADLQRANQLRIEGKPPEKVEAMLQVVYDNDYLPAGLPPRWEAQTPGWETVDDGKGFAYDGKTKDDAMLVYSHLVPPPEFWSRRRGDDDVLPANIQPQLITDFYSYNTSEAHGGYPVPSKILGNHWVGDLAVECRAEVQGGEGELILQLVEGGAIFECRIDVHSGTAMLGAFGDDDGRREVQTAVRGSGSYRLRFANIDDQLLLWVNGKAVSFDGHYARLEAPVPDVNDLTPVRVGTKGLAARFSELRVLRDVYYIAVNRDNPNSDNSEELRSADFFYDPGQWKELAHAPAIVLPLSEGRYMVCGDNSPRSYDSRMWRGFDEDTRETEYYVKRDLLIGKAVYIYWPHALPIPGLPDKWWFQLIPNVPRMGFVR